MEQLFADILDLQCSVITARELGNEEGGSRGQVMAAVYTLDIWRGKDSVACNHVYMLHILTIPIV